jgi:hypothetical protein
MVVLVKYVQLVPEIPPLEALQEPQGAQGAAVRSLCRLLSISPTAQITRIKRHPDLVAALQYVTVDTPGGPQPVAMLESWAIAVWVEGLHTTRLSPESQDIARLLKRHAYEAIRQAFAQQTTEAAPEIEHTIPSTTDAPAGNGDPWQRIVDGFSQVSDGFSLVAGGFSALRPQFTDLPEQVGNLSERVEDLSGRVGNLSERVEGLEVQAYPARYQSSAGLSAHQIGQLFLRLRLVRAQAGMPIDEAEARLAAHFGVAHISDIGADRWTDALVFIDRLLKDAQ